MKNDLGFKFARFMQDTTTPLVEEKQCLTLFGYFSEFVISEEFPLDLFESECPSANSRFPPLHSLSILSVLGNNFISRRFFVGIRVFSWFDPFRQFYLMINGGFLFVFRCCRWKRFTSSCTRSTPNSRFYFLFF